MGSPKFTPFKDRSIPTATDINTANSNFTAKFNNDVDNTNLHAGAKLRGSKFAAGAITSAKINLTSGWVTGSSTTLTASFADLTGSTVTLSFDVAQRIMIYATATFTGVIAASGTAKAMLLINSVEFKSGASEERMETYNGEATTVTTTMSRIFRTGVLHAGTYIAKFQGLTTVVAGTQTCTVNFRYEFLGA